MSAPDELDDFLRWISIARTSLLETRTNMERWIEVLVYRRLTDPECYTLIENYSEVDKVLAAVSIHLRLLNVVEADPNAPNVSLKVQSVVAALLYIDHKVKAMERQLEYHMSLSQLAIANNIS
ncbi:hypothetical protein SAMD00023353_4000740 [Rosellinia necatrix]|uniref:Uncharacterized protein n=1 Tax=Rosellinia necatrix TaxID=77044 RepID=A0A1W2TM74_ROSNE|nr:hypothetical protein SAMD00023353_4000740 [Rosellinia necatrix]